MTKTTPKPPAQDTKLSDKSVVSTSFIVSVSDVVLNLAVAFFTGSAVMLAQALQGLSDVTTAGVLYYGTRRSHRQADKKHPLGYGREIFFWALVSAFVMFLGTGVLSFYFGYRQFTNPHGIELVGLAAVMLIFGLTTNVYAFSRSVMRLNQNEGKESWWRRAFQSGMVETKITFVIDMMGSVAALFGLVAIIIVIITSNARFDGIGAMVVGFSTMIASLLIMVDVHALIIGRSISPELAEQIVRTATAHPRVNTVEDLYALYIGSDKLLVVIEVHLKDALTTDEIEEVTDEIKLRLQEEFPQIRRVQVEVEAPVSDLQE